MRSWTQTLLVTLVLGAWGPTLSAQEIGDRVRVRLFQEQDWTAGSLVEFASEGDLMLRGPIVEGSGATYRVSEIQRADWYKPNNVALSALAGLAGSAVFLLTSPCDLAEGSCLTGSKGGHITVHLGVGLAVGLIFHAIRPGSWKTWIEDGRVRR